jgi:hypothetical protein
MGVAVGATGGITLPEFTFFARTQDIMDFARESVTGRVESAIGIKVVRSGSITQLPIA